MATISPTLKNDLSEMGYQYNLLDAAMNQSTPDKAIEMNVYSWEPWFSKSFRLPKGKEVNLEWVMGKINTEKVYESFANNFKTLLQKEYGNTYNGLSVYPTTYGIGIFVAISYRNDVAQTKQRVEGLLNKYGIEYRNEYSEAGWVFRYVISKRKENIEKISHI